MSLSGGHHIALFFTGHQHAGENLADVLAHRSAELGPPIQMCDGLSHNTAGDFESIVANCIPHSRRKFVEVLDNFPGECRYVIEALRDIYRFEAQAKERELSPDERLRFHQEHSGPVMASLQTWIQQQFDERKVEPNSGLGEAIKYMQRHWEKLTLFLRQAGAPLDNNICEMAIKKAILHRKNAYFYKTENGAAGGDLFMSLIHTAELCGANPFDYIVALQRHHGDLAHNPGAWMPWNFPESGPTRSGPSTVQFGSIQGARGARRPSGGAGRGARVSRAMRGGTESHPARKSAPVERPDLSGSLTGARDSLKRLLSAPVQMSA